MSLLFIIQGIELRKQNRERMSLASHLIIIDSAKSRCKTGPLVLQVSKLNATKADLLHFGLSLGFE